MFVQEDPRKDLASCGKKIYPGDHYIMFSLLYVYGHYILASFMPVFPFLVIDRCNLWDNLASRIFIFLQEFCPHLVQ